MNRFLTYLLPGLLLAMLLNSCNSNTKRLNERITMWRNDKIPYGTWYAYNNLGPVFPNAKVVINKRSPDPNKIYKATTSKDNDPEDNVIADNNKTAYIIISSQVLPDEAEVNNLLSRVYQGQQVFISSFNIGSNLLDSLKLGAADLDPPSYFKDSLKISLNDPVDYDTMAYAYPGHAFDNYFEKMDSSITSILGKDEAGRANFVRISYVGGGAIYLHLAPLAFSNFFLLHKNNSTYFDKALSYLPRKTELVRWDDYYRYHARGEDNEDGRKDGFSALSWIMKQPGLRTSAWLLLTLVLIIYLVESKRKQRIIPVIKPLKNTSLDFVKTIGRLYFQRHDNTNLVTKMAAHFLEYVRNRYNIRTTVMDEAFEKRLAYKSGYHTTAVHELVYDLKMAQDFGQVTDEQLLQINYRLEKFYSATQ